MVNINKYVKALLHPAGGHQGSHKAHQAGNQRFIPISRLYGCELWGVIYMSFGWMCYDEICIPPNARGRVLILKRGPDVPVWITDPWATETASGGQLSDAEENQNMLWFGQRRSLFTCRSGYRDIALDVYEWWIVQDIKAVYLMLH